MGSAADRQTGGVDPDAAFPDVTGMTFDALLLAEDTALAYAVRRLLETDEEHYAAFDNFAPDNPGPPAVAPRDA